MLIITRKPGDEFQVGEARLRVSQVKGKQVTIQIEAPDHVAIVRDNAKVKVKEKM
jgi:carbon storage regulator CsrA